MTKHIDNESTKIEYLAYHESLTGLPNRRSLEDKVNQFLKTHKTPCNFALLFLDINKFKYVNDTHGYTIGDELLKSIATRLREKISSNEFIASLGGDKFVIALMEPSSEEFVAAYAKELLLLISKIFSVDDYQFRINASIGISFYTKETQDYNTLLRYADIALYYAKEQGRNNFRFFEIEMLDKINAKSQLEHDLHVALENNEFILYYQPLLCLKTNTCTGVEVLLRWKKKDGSVIRPEKFVDVSVESGLIGPMTQWILRTACHQLKCWRDSGLHLQHIAVNITAPYLIDAKFVDFIKQVLHEENLSGDSLELEITENILIEDIENTQLVINSLKQLGVKVTIDDFGTGYSSFNYLKRFYFDRIKIDQSFVSDIFRSQSDLAIVKAIIAVGKSLEVKLLAEGIETADQQQILTDLGCDEIQGYYYCRPNSVDIITAFLRRVELK
ncbi:MAG: EAL domain-containing protein [Gammaproteobacteria bacterium]